MPTVLLIEDDDESRRATSELFSREKWTVFEARDGEAGINLALKHRPEVILCDLLMPKANEVLGEVALAHFLLLLETKRAMIRRHHLQMIFF